MRKSILSGFALVLGVLAFSVRVSALASDELLKNAGFKSDLSSWLSNNGDAVWSNQDVNGSTSSGSAFITSSLTDSNSQVAQCVVLPGAGPFDVGGKFLIPSGQPQPAGGTVALHWYTNSTCAVPEITAGFQVFQSPNPTPTDAWNLVAGYRLTPPPGAKSVYVAFAIFKRTAPVQPTVHGYVDGTFFRLTSCTPSDVDLCVNGGRFRVTAQWESPNDGGVGHAVKFNDESGYFWFFESDNTEVVVKVHGACVDPWNAYWVFAAGLTNVLVTLHVEDTATGVANLYINPQGTAFRPLQDTEAFRTCP